MIECLGEKAEVLARLSTRLRAPDHQSWRIALDESSEIETSQNTEPASLTVTILDEIDAGKSLTDLHPLAGVGKRFTMLCDLSWECGTEGSLDGMLQRALDRLPGVIPTAEHGQILVRDSGPEKLYRKAHSPGLIPSLSMSSVRQAIVQKRGFLWTKAGDLSRSQIETNLNAGLYVPMVADGVICLETSHSTPEFQKSDLQLANALAHQLGLAIANPELRRELKNERQGYGTSDDQFFAPSARQAYAASPAWPATTRRRESHGTIICSDIRSFTNMASSELRTWHRGALRRCRSAKTSAITVFTLRNATRLRRRQAR